MRTLYKKSTTVFPQTLDTAISRYRFYLVLAILITSISKLLFTATTSLSLFSEETQYWLWSKNLDWNYYSKPLMIALYNLMSTSIFGDTAVGIRINAVLFSAAVVWIVFELSLLLFSNPRIAFWAGIMLVVMPFFHLASLFHTTDSSLLLFWTATMYFGWRAMHEDQLIWWICAAITTFLGILSKSTMILVIPIFLIHLLIFRPQKLIQKDFYLYCIISSLSLIPIFIWNLQNDFVTFRHVGTLSGIEGQKQLGLHFDSVKYIGIYAAGQILIVSIFFFPFLWMGLKTFMKTENEKLFYLAFPAISIWFLFFSVSIFKNVEVNWPAFAYVGLPMIMAWVIETKSENWKRYRVLATAISGILLVLILIPQTLDKVGFKSIVKPAKDPLVRLVGFRETGQAIDRLIEEWQISEYFIFSDSYHLASEMAFYVKGNPQTYCINLGRRKNQFDLWPGISQFENLEYHGIYITKTENLDERVVSGFEELLHAEKVYCVYRGDTVRVIHIQVLKNLKGIEEIATQQY